MAAVKTKVIDTTSTNPTEFLATGAGAPVPAMTGEQPAPVPETPVALGTPEATPSPTTVETAMAHPLMATDAVAVAEPDPFTLLKKWDTTTTKRSLRGLNVHGGVVLRHSTVILDGRMVECMVFVPGATTSNLLTAVEGQ